MNSIRDFVDIPADLSCSVRVKEFRLPAVPDVLVLGRRAAVGCHALRKALHLLAPVSLVHLELDDEMVSDLLVRETLLAQLAPDWLERLVLQYVRPRMCGDEILQLTLDFEWRLQTLEPHDTVVRP
ncbi:hypothetical protein MIT9_P1227 [Methylomarinovum caldicuralii]|uniref:Uncharacterized protein n=1 Tax=Methylomarinovum caldicuralii TaxID=438856 RepID=A0AAU9CAV9_9GAMM|nr:hypothetical protein [Methylomarinovum caldicuralii]BCX81649.1 hypothetical protein MIT9_P1227 [Methylomarinovum caldicuralii]